MAAGDIKLFVAGAAAWAAAAPLVVVAGPVVSKGGPAA